MNPAYQSVLESLLPPELKWTESDLESSVTERLLKVAAATPDAPALTGLDGTRFTYAELRQAVIALAEQIVELTGDGPGRVAAYVDREHGAIISVLAILAAGKAYVPIDPVEANDRVSAKLDHAGAEVVVAPPSLLTRAGELVDQRRIVNRESLSTTAAITAPVRSGPEDLLNLVYTSGSTGLPKGVIQTQRNVLFDTAAGAGDMGTLPSDRFGLVMPLTMGGSISDMLGSLLNGASLHVFDLRNFGSAAMAPWMSDNAITMTHMAPTVFRRWMAELDPDDRYPKMRAIKLGGESVYHTDVAAFSRHFGPDCVLRNGLGTTETYLITALMLSPGDTVEDGIVPVGHPVAGKSVVIVDDAGSPLPDGEIGNITVIGDFLSPGYWLDEATTNLKYGVDTTTGIRTYQPGDLGRIRPQDGMLEHLGRSDDTVKINGNRVEVGEVEAALLDLESVTEAAVVAQPMGDGSSRLVAYVVSSDGVSQTQLRTTLAGRMPMHMVPSLFIQMETLPVLSFGKIDRRALPLPDGTRPELDVPYRAPSSDLERLVTSRAATLLQLDEVGADDDLFALGMDSLLATGLLASTGEELGRSLTLDVLLDNPTAAGLATRLAAAEGPEPEIDLESLVAELEDDERSELRS